MTNSVVPALIDALVSTARTALPNAVVIDGVTGPTDNPGDYLMVGWQDPDATADASEAAVVEQTQMAFGSTRPRMEQGSIHMAARSVNGNNDQKAARDAVYAMHEALAAALRTTSDLGVTGVMQLSNGSTLTLDQDSNESGTVATLRYDVAFTAQI